MHDTSPFEISLSHELDEDRIRMANDWFFKWHSINIPNHAVDVEDFYGGRIRVGGIVFQGQIRDIYWSSVGKHLIDRVHMAFRRWETECASYPASLKRSSLEALERSLNRYIARIVEEATKTDEGLQRRGDPVNVPLHNFTGTHSRANVEVVRLKAAHLALLPQEQPSAPSSIMKRVEDHLTKWRGLYAGLSLLIAVTGLAIKFFF